jgi:mannan endo-1,4-beta-mannosidase
MPLDKRALLLGLGQLALAGPAWAAPPDPPRLSNPNATPRARALYRYLNDLAGKKTLTGQMESNWTGNPRMELDYIRACSGKLPAILGLDYLDPEDNAKVNDRAAHWYLREGGVPTICWHWGAPDVGTGYENSKHAFDLDAALRAGTPQNKAMMRDLDQVADLLAELQKRDVPVLWRPLHEFTGTWFWWGQHGPEGFKALWTRMHDHFTKVRGLNHLIWVLGYSGEPRADYNPGRAYFDIAGADTYVKDHGPLKALYDKVVAIVGDGVPIALHENGPIPDPALVQASGADWAYFMTWHTRWIKDPETNPPALISAAYNSPRYVTLDALPDLKTYPAG